MTFNDWWQKNKKQSLESEYDTLKWVWDAAVAAEQARIMENAKKKGWAMRNEDPFEDYVKEVIEMRR
jgi:hypothetical protein